VIAPRNRIFLWVAPVNALWLAAPLRRWTAIGVLFGMVMIGIGTIVEAPLLQALAGGGSPPKVYDLLAVNSCTSLLVLLVAAIVRFNGYALTRSQPVQTS
jgi:hypothetical protein